MDYYKDALMKKYADFGGRARRKEYWMFVLFNFLISFALGVIDSVAGLKFGEENVPGGAGILQALYALGVLVPSLAVSVRRLHDTGKNGLMILVNFIPCIGWIIYLVWMIQDSQPGSNEYGPNPKGE